MRDAMPNTAAYLFALADIILQMRGIADGGRTRYEDSLCVVAADPDGSDVEVTGTPLGPDFAGQVVACRREGGETFDPSHGFLVRHMEGVAARCFEGVHVFTFEVLGGSGNVTEAHVRASDLVDAREHAMRAFGSERVVGLCAARTPAVFAQSSRASDPVSVTRRAMADALPSTEVRRPGDERDHVFWFTFHNILESGGTGPQVRMPVRALDLADAQGLLRLIRPARGIRLVRIEITTLVAFAGIEDPEEVPMLLVAPGVLLRDAVESGQGKRAA